MVTAKRRDSVLLLSALSLLVALTLACAATQRPTPPPTQTPGLATITPSGTEPTAISEGSPGQEPTSTPRPTSSLEPLTATPKPPTATPELPTPTPGPRRIRFASGQISATIAGHIEERGLDEYVLRALGGQTMKVVITSPNNDVLLTIFGEDGIPLKRYVDGSAEWTGVLPATQDYNIHAVSVGPETDYTMVVTIYPLEQATRIQFEAGATSATVAGSLSAGETETYVLRAIANQGLFVSVTSPLLDVVPGIKGADGDVLVDPTTGLTFAVIPLLPATQDYFISVVSVGGNSDYTLTIFITPLSALPERIQFGPGEVSATVQGALGAGGDFDAYVVRAATGQSMEISVSAPGAPVAVIVVGADGSHWYTPYGGGPLTIDLPATQDYAVTVTTQIGASATGFTMEVTITGP